MFTVQIPLFPESTSPVHEVSAQLSPQDLVNRWKENSEPN